MASRLLRGFLSLSESSNHLSRCIVARKKPLRHPMNRAVSMALASALVIGQSFGSDFHSAAATTNRFGIDLYQKVAVGEANLCLSPYSISCVLVMAYDGAMGETR